MIKSSLRLICNVQSKFRGSECFVISMFALTLSLSAVGPPQPYDAIHKVSRVSAKLTSALMCICHH